RAANDLRGRRHVELSAVGGRGPLVLRHRGAPARGPGQPVPRVRPEDVHHLHALRARLRRDPPYERDHARRQGFQHAHRLRRGRFHYDALRKRDYLSRPLIRRGDAMAPVSWSDALDEVAGRLSAIVRQHGAKAVGFLGWPLATNEEGYLLQKVARLAAGTNN